MKLLFLLAAFFFITLYGNCQWSNTTNEFTDSVQMPVCTSIGDQNRPIVIKSYPDSGYFVMWEDHRRGFYEEFQVFAQKYDKNGKQLWADNGVPISASTNTQRFTISSNQDYRNRKVAATDSAGGFYIAYIDDSIATYDWQRICVQHFKSNGSRVFGKAGFIVAQTIPGQNNNYDLPQLIADDNGGFYVAYIDRNMNDYIYVYNYKDESGIMKLNGGGRVNDNAVQKKEAEPCVGAYRWYVYYPGTTVLDYNIWPDLQGGCSVIMSLNGNTGEQYKMLGYNRVWKAKKDSRVTIHTSFPTGDPDSMIINYKKGDIDILYKLRHNLLNGSCTSNTAHYFWVDDILLSNGFQLLDQGGYNYDYPKGTAISTTGNINVDFVAYNARSLNGSIVSASNTHGIAIPVEKYIYQ